jgi:hypothetical protein
MALPVDRDEVYPKRGSLARAQGLQPCMTVLAGIFSVTLVKSNFDKTQGVS